MLRSLVVAGAGLLALAGSAVAAGTAGTAGAATTSGQPNRPMYAVLPHASNRVAPDLGIPNWTFTYSYSSKSYSDVFLGSNPSGGGSTTIPVYIIPLKLTRGTYVTNPLKKYSGVTTVQRTLNSPIFQDEDYTQGGTDVGNTQYEDAVQRASLWGLGGDSAGYHVLLGTPTVEPEQSLAVPTADSVTGKPFGTKVMEISINWFDPEIQAMISSLGIPANALPIFLTTQTYLLEKAKSGCCIGGYHSYTGTQPYIMTTYIQQAGEFAQDVSALSHEMGETINDPTTTNTDVPASCGTHGNDQRIYETGDPLEIDVNYGDYPYTLGGYTYHLQDLVMPPYFGAPTADSVNGWSTFQGTSLTVCQNGG
ncbi:MAG TPA: hypothetical protein VKA05_09855 [Acidimicrobiales bacterium]|nr:hypothetical protein [Acidimicrobiales bacterium]